MSPSSSFSRDADPRSPGALVADREEASDELAAASAERFQALLPRVVAQVVGEGPATEEALENGGFVLNESTVVMRLNPDTDSLEFFCDIGLPDAHHEHAAFRAALELNLCRTYPGVTFGVHPESGRLVATSAMHMLLVVDDEVCLNTLNLLTQLAQDLRAKRTFVLVDER